MAKNDPALSTTTPSAPTPASSSAPNPTAVPGPDGKATPAQWAKVAFPMQRKGGPDAAPRYVSHPSFWQHKAAAALHGWADHEHHAGAPIRLTADEYYKALVAASEPAKDGNYLAHLPACSPHGAVAKQLAAYAAAQPKS